MEQELKEVDGVAGVASETSLSISPSPLFFSFFFFGLLIFATLSTCRRRRNSWRYQKPTQKKKKKKKKRIILLSVTANQLGRVDSLPILLGFRAFCSAYFWRENDKKGREKKNGNRWQGWPCPVVRVSMAIFGQNNPVGEWMGGQLGEQHSHNTAKPRFTMK